MLRKLTFTAFTFALIISLITSCAIHPRFPFICFNEGCIKKQLGINAAKEAMKRGKINSTVRKKKRQMNHSRNRAAKDKTFPPDPVLQEEKNRDSLAYVKGFAGLCKDLKIVFISEAKKECSDCNADVLRDSVIVIYKFDERELSEESKAMITTILGNPKKDHLEEIIIKNCHNKSVMSETELFYLNERIRRIKKYLKKSGIPEKQISEE